MRLPRPYIPMPVRIKVAMKQGLDAGLHKTILNIDHRRPFSRGTLEQMLRALFGTAPFELDHIPALAQRKFNPRTGKYTPDANDPAYLVYRLRDDHRTKTYLRGDGAQRSDVSQQRYLKRIAARKKPRTKFKPRKTKHIKRSHAVQGHGDKA